MMPDIFSSFDPMSYSPLMNTQITMSLSIIIMLMLQLSFWSNFNRFNSSMTFIMTIIFQQLSRTFSTHLKAMSTSISSLFVTLITINLLGLNPYSMSMSSHLIFTLSFGLPLWMMMIMSSVTHKPKSFIAHFLPDGAPTWLNPFLILIETVSITVRPLTLSFRLAANMSAGHIVLTLVGLYAAIAVTSISFITLMLIATTIIYILFEVAICLIQAYIFCLLLTLYADDHAH